jgi:hypothetical protein
MFYHCPQQKLCKWYVLDSLDKDGERRFDALDRVLGEGSLIRPQYGIGQNTVKMKPDSLTFFELIFLAQTVHEFAPQYMTLEKNCYRFCTMVFNACKVLYSHYSEDDDKPHWHYSEIFGRWKGLKINQVPG